MRTRKVSWEDVYLDLAATYEHILAYRAISYGGDPTGLAGRNVRFGGYGRGRGRVGGGCDEQALGLAVQYDSTFGKPAKDYTELVENQTPVSDSARPHSLNNSNRDGQVDNKKT